MMPPRRHWPRLFQLPKTREWRVKLCRLESDAWLEHGFGLIWGERSEKENEAWLLVANERRPDELLLRCKVKAPLSFRKQDTLLFCAAPEDHINLQSEGTPEHEKPSDGLVRMAIGFQDAIGCATVCDFLIYAAYHWSPGVTLTVQYVEETSGEVDSELVVEPLSLPPLPNRENTEMVVEIISRLLRTSLGREFLSVYLDQEHFLDRTHDLFQEMENASQDLPAIDRIRTLWSLSDVMKQYFLIGDSYLIDNMVQSDQFFKVIGMLEYDRAFGKRKANFRDYYSHHTELKQVVEIADTPVLEKIRRTFRLQLLRDILVRSADDFPFQILRTLIYINQVEIVDSLQSSTTFCEDLFGLFDSNGAASASNRSKEIEIGRPSLQPSSLTTIELRERALKFINEILKTSRTFTTNQMRELYENLCDYGLFNILNHTITSERSLELKVVALESLGVLLDFDSQLATSQLKNITETLTALLCEPAGHRDGEGMAVQAMQIQASEIMKKLMAEEPKLISEAFFEHASKYMRTTSEPMGPESLRHVLDFLSFACARAPAQAADLVISHNLWSQVSSVWIAQTEGRGEYDTEVLVALVQAIRDTLAMPTSDEAGKRRAVEQAKQLANTELANRIIRLFVRWGNENRMVHSSMLNMMYAVAEGILRGEPQFTIVGSEMTIGNDALSRKLTSLFPFLREIQALNEKGNLDSSAPPHTGVDKGIDESEIDASQEEIESRHVARKRSTSSEHFMGARATANKSRRPRLLQSTKQQTHSHHHHQPQQPHQRPLVDEVDSAAEQELHFLNMSPRRNDDSTPISEKEEQPDFKDTNSSLFGLSSDNIDNEYLDQFSPGSPSHSFWIHSPMQPGIAAGGHLPHNGLHCIHGASAESHEPDFG